ncbi:MAG: M18 family aminopeptidase [Actinomycetales bacterium]|nr:M18 family aminopeptidase [Actinomycetales bacterium]
MTARHIEDFCQLVHASPSAYHAVAEVARRLDAAGFARVEEAGPTADSLPDRGYVIRDGAIVAWDRPAGATADAPLRIVGSHTDSPGFKLKPRPSFTNQGWLQAAVEVYGGPILASWLDRELELAGRLVLRDGTERLVRTGPLLRIPHLAIHLDRSVNEELKLDKQRHTAPVLATTAGIIASPSGPDPLLAHLAALAGVDAADVGGHDLITVDAAAPATFGLHGDLLASPRLDNLASVHSSLVAFLAGGAAAHEGAGGLVEGAGRPEGAVVGPPASQGEAAREGDTVRVLAAFEHEEIGSVSRSGADGSFLEDVIDRLTGWDPAARARALAGSWLVSSDVGHSVHPSYAERHDPTHQPVAGGGPILKVNANQRYTTDAHGAALWSRACRAAGVGEQVFVSNNAMPCGSTIGPMASARLGIRTVDVGIPILSMHSARELCHTSDLLSLTATLASFYRGT